MNSSTNLRPPINGRLNILPRKTVIVYTGPDASDQKKQVSHYANTRGINYTQVDWPFIKPYINKYAMSFVHNGYLNINHYPINDDAVNRWVDKLASEGVKFLLSCDASPSIPVPDSFLIIRCNGKEVIHG